MTHDVVTIIRPEWKCLIVANTLAYFIGLKRFIVQAPWIFQFGATKGYQFWGESVGP